MNSKWMRTKDAKNETIQALLENMGEFPCTMKGFLSMTQNPDTKN